MKTFSKDVRTKTVRKQLEGGKRKSTADILEKRSKTSLSRKGVFDHIKLV